MHIQNATRKIKKKKKNQNALFRKAVNRIKISFSYSFFKRLMQFKHEQPQKWINTLHFYDFFDFISKTEHLGGKQTNKAKC